MDQATGDVPHTLQAVRRMQSWLRQRHPRHTAKLVSRDTGADERTVERWLSEENPQPPIWRHWMALCGTYGGEFVAHVCAPGSDWHRHERRKARLEQLERELVRSLEMLRAHRAER